MIFHILWFNIDMHILLLKIIIYGLTLKTRYGYFMRDPCGNLQLYYESIRNKLKYSQTIRRINYVKYLDSHCT